MLSCAQTGGSWGNNFRRRRRQGAIGETEARQLALISKFGLCGPTDMTLDAPLPTEPEEWFQAQHLPHALAIRVGFLQPHMHAALGLPRATLLLLRSFCSVIFRSKGFRHGQIQHVSARSGPATRDGHHCKTIRGTYEAGGRRHLRTYRLLLTWALQPSM